MAVRQGRGGVEGAVELDRKVEAMLTAAAGEGKRISERAEVDGKGGNRRPKEMEEVGSTGWVAGPSAARLRASLRMTPSASGNHSPMTHSASGSVVRKRWKKLAQQAGWQVLRLRACGASLRMTHLERSF